VAARAKESSKTMSECIVKCCARGGEVFAYIIGAIADSGNPPPNLNVGASSDCTPNGGVSDKDK
jgi:hypothetical protein